MNRTVSFDSIRDLLRQLVRTPSFSRQENGAANLVAGFLADRGVACRRKGNNVWAFNLHADPARETLLLNSHLDTVSPNGGYTRDPFDGQIEGGRLYGLGSNDAGASVVSLIAAFLHFYDKMDLKYNLALALTAEEECSGSGGTGGIESIWPDLGPIAAAIVGEPTGLRMAVAERGLMVLDCMASGRAGHAARGEGINAIYRALPDIEWFRDFHFPKVSPLLGEVGMAVTVIGAGTQHNVVPAECTFAVDVRLNELYTHQEVLDIVREHVQCRVTPRSTRLRPSSIAPDHPLAAAGRSLGLESFGSPTLSDQALIPVPSLKLGPGLSERSHSADEYVELAEIEAAIDTYIRLLGKIL
jgi:acetylornithine deacetylase